MPVYPYLCDCGKAVDEFRSMAERDNAPLCCGKPMARQIVSPQVMPDIQPYQSMVDGTLITSRSHHREHLKQHGCEEVGNDSSLFHEPRPLKPPPGLKDVIIQAAHKHLRYR